MTNINLIPQRRLQAKRRKRQIRWCVGACCAYALAAAATGAAALYSWGGQDPAVTQQLAHVDQEIQRTEHALSAARTRLSATQVTLDTAHQIIDHPDWSQLLALLAREGNGQVVLRSVQLHPRVSRTAEATGGFLMSAAGVSHAPAEAQEYAVRLQNSGMFDRVSLLDTRREPFFDVPATSFRIECDLGTTDNTAGGKEQR